MSGEPELHWRETYFILFDQANRPTLTQVERALGELNHRYELKNLQADDDGHLESISLNAPEDRVAIEISFESGEAVAEQTTQLAKQLQGEADSDQLAALLRADARFDVMHFEMVDSEYASNDEDELDDMLDPSCLLLVVDAMVELTAGLPIDPSSGAILP